MIQNDETLLDSENSNSEVRADLGKIGRLSRRDFLKIGALFTLGSIFGRGKNASASGVRGGEVDVMSSDLKLPVPTGLRRNDLESETATLSSRPTDRLKPTQEQQDFLVSNHIDSVDASRNMCSLTYDDWPAYPEQLKTILDSLKKGGAHATFFLIGHQLDWLGKGQLKPYGWPNADLIRRILDEGHEIGCHTFTHGSVPLTDMGAVQLEREFSLWFDAMNAIIPNYQPAFFRAPGGTINLNVLKMGAKYGMQHAMWNGESNGMVSDTRSIVDRLAKPGSLILSHMQRPYDVSEADYIITDLNKRGLVLATLSDAIDPSKKLPRSELASIQGKLSFF